MKCSPSFTATASLCKTNSNDPKSFNILLYHLYNPFPFNRWGGVIGHFVLIFCFTIMLVSCNLVVTCWELSDLLVFLFVIFSCTFVTFLLSFLSQVQYLNVSIPDFDYNYCKKVIMVDEVLKWLKSNRQYFI